ncbi:MAG: pilus assembly protein N-terminal domain-containing protein [Aquamicrobium sp.]|uniref:pilus assembly protein N-terminal domain-containing protein n=1 Tax=Aquamicrobium sp. TaxID=1872579 RepID=UPI00349E6FD5|nr:pilus assembly protein N-terminal domain-containing protein [Aquamicrobium sp.]MCO5155759.1 pilus assembly protein N-terminal domain-containing protein [Aquamicrobium sp.]
MARRVMKLTGAAVLAACAALYAAAPASAETIRVFVDQARVVKLARPADTIIVGNPQIADAAVQDASTVVLTGKGFGVTNLVILDRDGAAIVDEQVVVSRASANAVNVYRRSSLEALSCSPYCEAQLRSGE